MKNSLIIDENGLLEMFSSTDDGTNSLEVNETEIPSSSWVGSGNYTFTIGGQTYTIGKASSSTGNWQLIQDSDYAFHFQRVISITEEIASINYEIGDTPMGTTATTITGAIAEHEGDINSLNYKASLAMTRTNNIYVDATAFGRLSAFKRGNMLFMNGNLSVVTASAMSDFVQIGTVSGWDAVSDCYLTIPCQADCTKILLVRVRYNGVIQIYSATGLIQGFYRFALSVPAN